jgi:Ca2+-transporting ATPase
LSKRDFRRDHSISRLLFHTFNVVNARCGEPSLRPPVPERVAEAGRGSVCAPQLLGMYVPALQRAFGTTGLGSGDWALCVAVASSVLWLSQLDNVTARTRRH